MNVERNRSKKSSARGFTIIEILVVVTIIGLLAGIAAVQVNKTMKTTKMNILKHDLRQMRDLIQQYKIDKKKYPESIQALVDEGYLRAVPVDPITDATDTWVEIHNEPDLEEDPENADTGVIDVQSGAPGNDVDGIPYIEY